MLDKPTYPEFGNIYPGDYYPDIPWEEYINPRQPLPAGKIFDIRDWGAKPEKDLLNTEAIAACCRACGEAGGGVILVEGGSYVTGTVRLPSNCTLFIAHGSALKASRDVEQLLTHDDTYTDDRKGESVQGALLLIDHAENVWVTGGGRICGSGEWYVYEPRQKPALTPFPVTMLPRRDQVKEINTVPGSIRTFYRDRIRYSEDKYGEGKPDLRRPSAMVWVQESREVVFGNIILEASMSWTLHVDRCDHVTVRDVVASYIYSNTLVVLEVTGAVLREALEQCARYFAVDEDGHISIAESFLRPKEAHYNYDYFYGIEYAFDLSRPEGHRVTLLSRHGAPIRPEDRLTLCMCDYRATGSGNFDCYLDCPRISENLTQVSELILSYLVAHPMVELPEEHPFHVTQNGQTL